SQKAADILGRVGGGDQFFARRRVHAVVARRNGGRAGDSDVHFSGAGFADHADDFAAGGSSYDRVVHQNNAFTLHEPADSSQLELDPEIADRLRRLNEGAADVVVADQAHAKRNARLHRIADRGRNAGVGNRNDNVRLDRMLARQQAAELFAALV